MSSVRSMALSGFIALVLAVSVIAAVTFSGASGQLGSAFFTTTNGTTQTNTSSGQTRSNSGNVQSTTTSSLGGAGILSVLITDPPHVPAGVTKVYVSYRDLAAHTAQAQSSMGWVTLKSTGQVELLGTLNVTQTLSSASLPNGNYDALRFNVSSALVTFNGKNYTAFVQSALITATIEGGTHVSNSKATAAVVDIQPTVINIGSLSTPEFVIRAVARAFSVPSGEVNEQMKQDGYRMSLLGKQWWSDDEAKFSTTLQIMSASLTANAVTLTAKNSGSENAALRMIIISPLASPQSGDGGDDIPNQFFGSAILRVLSNQSMVPLLMHAMTPYVRSGDNSPYNIGDLFGGGYNLTSGSSVTLSYTGSIYLVVNSNNPNQTIVSGTQYRITLLADEAVASIVITAG
ncbi:MAG: DUF4382 domain-containing protein [Thaumarchaeota archaeon]|nr:DUF4382 domain-containing protein [Nitrososphaerota archaeon]